MFGMLASKTAPAFSPFGPKIPPNMRPVAAVPSEMLPALVKAYCAAFEQKIGAAAGPKVGNVGYINRNAP